MLVLLDTTRPRPTACVVLPGVTQGLSSGMIQPSSRRWDNKPIEAVVETDAMGTNRSGVRAKEKRRRARRNMLGIERAALAREAGVTKKAAPAKKAAPKAKTAKA